MVGVVLSVAGAAVTVIIVLLAVGLVFVPPRKAAALQRSTRALGIRTSRVLDTLVHLPALAVQVPAERLHRITIRGGPPPVRAAEGVGRRPVPGVRVLHALTAQGARVARVARVARAEVGRAWRRGTGRWRRFRPRLHEFWPFGSRPPNRY